MILGAVQELFGSFPAVFWEICRICWVVIWELLGTFLRASWEHFRRVPVGSFLEIFTSFLEVVRVPSERYLRDFQKLLLESCGSFFERIWVAFWEVLWSFLDAF